MHVDETDAMLQDLAVLSTPIRSSTPLARDHREHLLDLLLSALI